MDARYSIYFAGELLDGHDRATVRAGLAKLFNADEATLDKLFSGKAQMIKRGCDKATALKYKQAMERAGAQPGDSEGLIDVPRSIAGVEARDHDRPDHESRMQRTNRRPGAVSPGARHDRESQGVRA